MRGSHLAVLCIVLFAGCASLDPGTPSTATPDRTPPLPATAPPSPTPPPTTTEAVTTVTTGAESATPPTARTPTATPTPTGLENPWGHDPVVVAVNDTAGGAHDRYAVFREALAYWRVHDAEYAGVDVPFSFQPDAEDPDITIRYVESIERCGETESVSDPLGCAPYYRDQEPQPHTVVFIRENEDDQQLLETVKHEWGHVLGIAHGEDPMPLMAENNLYLLASPWDPANVTYYVDYADKPGYAESEYDEEIEAALGYLADGADGNLDPAPTFTRVDRRSDANIVIEFHDDPLSSTGDPGSRGEAVYEGQIQGEPYRRFTIGIYDLEPAVTSYHVAYWYAQVVIGEEASAYPDILHPDRCDSDCRRGEWYR